MEKGCQRIAFLSISSYLAINSNRLDGYKAALLDSGFPLRDSLLVQCTNDAENNHLTLLRLMEEQRPDGVIASVEKLITPLYLACRESGLLIPDDVKIVGFSNLATAPILRPALTTITQPAFEMGKAAATVLFKALEKRNYRWQEEDIVLPSALIERESSGKGL
jgi:LacI family transcriptional regulator